LRPRGFDFASCTSSFTDFTGSEGCTTISRSEEFTGATATKSFISVNGFFGTSDSFTVCVFDIISSV
jgi:hypothetical protein